MDDELKQYLDSMGHRMEAMEHRMEAMEDRLTERINSSITGLEGRLMKRIDESERALEDRLIERMRDTETTLLTEFHKWASPVDTRVRALSSMLRAVDADLDYLQERVKRLEDRPTGT